MTARRKPHRLGRHWREHVKPRILERDGYRCHWCGNRATTVDHLVARAQGGALFDPRNLVASCVPCNLSRGGKLGAERAAVRRRLPPPIRVDGARVWVGAINLDPEPYDR